MKGKIKPGLSQMISQAWHQHRRDQLATSTTSNQIKDVYEATWDADMRKATQEIFAVELQFPSTFVTEVYTDTEPVAKATRRRGLIAGESLTLDTGWDFRDKEHQQKGLDHLNRVKPYVAVLAFPCGPWSQLQALNPAFDLERMRAEAHELVSYAIQVAKLQLKGRRHYVMENPKGSLVWKLSIMEAFVESTGALEVTVDMCRFNLQAPRANCARRLRNFLLRCRPSCQPY